MTVVTTETYRVRRVYGDNPRAEIPYLVSGTDSESAVRDAIRGVAPSSYDGLFRADIDISHDGGSVWECRVSYTPQGASDTAAEGTAASENSDSVTLDFRASTIRRRVSFQTIASYGPTSVVTVPDFQGAVEFDGERVNGVDVFSGATEFSLTRRFMDEEISEDYVDMISRKAFKYNEDSVWMWQPGEVLFLGAQLARSGGGAIVEDGDDDDSLSGYNLITGLTSNNTDDGKLYAKLVFNAGFVDAYLYKSSGMTAGTLVANTSLAAANTTATLVEANGSGIGGQITIGDVSENVTGVTITFPKPWQITFRFSVSPNAVNGTDSEISVKLGDDATETTIEKIGWDYLWFSFEQAKSGAATIERPKFAYVEKVYHSTTFAELNIGPSPFAAGSGS